MPTMYGVQRSEKYKKQDVSGIQKEACRTANRYNNDVDTNKSQHNISIINSCDWTQKINDTITNTGVRVRKDSVMMIGSIYTATGGFFQKQADESKQEYSKRIVGYFKDCLQWHKKTYCHNDESLILSATIHLDETTPHMHVYSIPIIEKDGKYVLSAKSIMGNKKAYTDRVDSFYNEVSKKYGLERGEATPDGQIAKKHIETQKYKLSKLNQDLSAAKAELTVVESDKIMADFEKQELQQDIRSLKSKKEKECKQIEDLQKHVSVLTNKRQMQHDGLQQDKAAWAKFHTDNFGKLEWLEAFYSCVEQYESDFCQTVNNFLDYEGTDPNYWPDNLYADEQEQYIDDEIEL